MKLLSCEKLTLEFGGLTALLNVTFDVYQNEIFSIIGPNGAGKTSLINCVTGVYKPNKGTISFEGKNIDKIPRYARVSKGIVRTFQNIELFRNMTVLENLMLGRHIYIDYPVTDAGIFWGKAQSKEIVNRKKVEEIIDFLRIQNIRHMKIHSLSYGQRKLVELGRALASNPKLLLLDEPMAGMNFEEKRDIGRFILDINKENGITVVLIEHDLSVVFDISSRILVLDFGKIVTCGSGDVILSNSKVTEAFGLKV